MVIARYQNMKDSARRTATVSSFLRSAESHGPTGLPHRPAHQNSPALDAPVASAAQYTRGRTWVATRQLSGTVSRAAAHLRPDATSQTSIRVRLRGTGQRITLLGAPLKSSTYAVPQFLINIRVRTSFFQKHKTLLRNPIAPSGTQVSIFSEFGSVVAFSVAPYRHTKHVLDSTCRAFELRSAKMSASQSRYRNR